MAIFCRIRGERVGRTKKKPTKNPPEKPNNLRTPKTPQNPHKSQGFSLFTHGNRKKVILHLKVVFANFEALIE